MRKLRLDLEDLRVESFDTAPRRDSTSGTVFAQGSVTNGVELPCCFELTCGGPTCPGVNTCSTCGQNTCSTCSTCGSSCGGSCAHTCGQLTCFCDDTLP